MAAPIQSPAKCEVRSVIRFLNARGERPAEIHKPVVAVYGNVMNRQNVTKWCREFTEGSSTTMMTRGYRRWFQDLINIWTMPATMLKNKVMYRKFIQCRFCKLKLLYMFKTFVSLLTGHASYIYASSLRTGYISARPLCLACLTLKLKARCSSEMSVTTS